MNQNNSKLVSYWSDENYITASYPLYCDYLTERWIDRLIKDLAGQRVLDIGCGLGRMLKYFNRRGARAFGIDITPVVLQKIPEKTFPVSVGDARSLPFRSNSFDLVFSLGVVEHFRETPQAISEHLRVCKGGGRVIVIVPNLITPYQPLTLLWHILRGSLIKKGLMISCGKMYSRGRLRRYLRQSGACNINIFGYYGSAILKFVTRKTDIALCDIVEKIYPSRLFGHLLFGIAEKEKKGID